MTDQPSESGRSSRDTVAFVSAGGGLGGPSRSLATVLANLNGRVNRALLAPDGSLSELVRRRASAEVYVRLPRWRRWSWASRLLAAGRIATWAMKNRDCVLAFHANGQAALNLVVPSALLLRIPIVMWAHASEPSPSLRLFGGVWRRILPNLRWAAVSPEAHQTLLDSHLVTPSTEVSLIPNPIDPADVVAQQEIPRNRVTIGYLKGKAPTSGFHMLPDVVERLSDLPIRWLVFTRPPIESAPAYQQSTWIRLQPFVGSHVEMRGRVPRVDLAYAECDMVFCPSLRESFGRVAAEAMLNGIPLAASDIPVFRRHIGNGEAGLLFPVGDTDSAAQQLRLLAEDSDLRRRLGDRGRKRAEAFLPAQIVDRLCELYGVSRRPNE